MRPLDNVRVIVMAGLAPAPYAGMILADFGAEVIRVDRSPTTGSRADPTRDHLARGKRDVGAAVVADQEAVAVGMPLEAAGDEVELGRDAELALPVDEELAAIMERRDLVVERASLAPAEAEALGELVGRERHAGVGQRREDPGGGGRGGGGFLLL